MVRAREVEGVDDEGSIEDSRETRRRRWMGRGALGIEGKGGGGGGGEG